MEEWGLLEDCLRLTHGGKNLFLLDGRTAALRFCHTSKSRVYRVVKRLELKGWLIKAGGGTRNKKTGMYDNTAYRVLQHEDIVSFSMKTGLRLTPVPI
jgi:transposase